MDSTFVPKQPAYMAAAQLAGALGSMGLHHDDLVAFSEVLHERHRQAQALGYTPDHDRSHTLTDWLVYLRHELEQVGDLDGRMGAPMTKGWQLRGPDDIANHNIAMEEALGHLKHLAAVAVAAYAAMYQYTQENRRKLRDEHGVEVEVTRPDSGARIASPPAMDGRPVGAVGVAAHPDGGLVAHNELFATGGAVTAAELPAAAPDVRHVVAGPMPPQYFSNPQLEPEAAAAATADQLAQVDADNPRNLG